MNWHERDKLASQPIRKSLISLAAPAVLSTFFTGLFEIIDMFWVGKINADAQAALSAASFFIWMIRGLGLTISAAALALVARRTGEKNEHGLFNTIIDSSVITFLFALFMIILLFLPAISVFKVITLQPAVAGLAHAYNLVFLSGLVFVYMMMTAEFILRGLGDTRRPMQITAIALLINAILDPVFIFTFDMGIQGAAYATIFAQSIGAAVMMILIVRRSPALKQCPLTFRRFFNRPFCNEFWKVMKIGGPLGLSDAGFSLIYLFLCGIIAIFGKEPLAALGIAHRLEAIPFFVCLGVSMAVEPMVGQFLGAGEISKARETTYLSLKITTAVISVILAFYVVFPKQLYGIFTTDPAVIANGVSYLRSVALFDIFLSFEVILSGAFSGAGDNQAPFLICFPLTFIRIPIAYLFVHVLGLGVTSVWLIIGVTTFLKGIGLFYQFKKGHWAQKKI